MRFGFRPPGFDGATYLLAADVEELREGINNDRSSEHQTWWMALRSARISIERFVLSPRG